jgi:sulfur-carrier protein
MPVQVLFFGPLSEVVDAPDLLFHDVADTNQLVAALTAQYPGLTGVKYIIAVDKQVVSVNTALGENATVALLPPFSGG